MNVVNENDLELLETYLDGELADADAAALRRRLSDEPALASAMAQLSQERQVRHEALCSLESDAAPLGATISRALQQAAVREVVWTSRLRIVRQVSSLAACLIVGLSVGWFAHSRTEVRQPTGDLATFNSSDNGAPTNPNVTPVSLDSHRIKGLNGGFNVAITDDFGRVVAQQRFDTLNEARAFSNDLLQWQNHQRQVRNGDIRLVGDDF